MDEIILEAKGITKRFPGVLANDQITFDLRRGEVHALLGENGAGKTTLMNILYGLYQADEGEVLVRRAGDEVQFALRCNRRRDWYGPPAFYADPGLYGGRKHHARR